jgi:hypothetical protein
MRRVHLLRKPPAIALDARIYDRYRPHFDALEITDTETRAFERWRFVIERGYGRQYALELKRRHTNTLKGEQLLLEV